MVLLIFKKRSIHFYVRITGSFECFQYFFDANFLKRDFFLQKWSNVFQLKTLRLKTQYFHTKLPCKKPLLRQMDLSQNKITIFFGKEKVFFKKGVLISCEYCEIFRNSLSNRTPLVTASGY